MATQKTITQLIQSITWYNFPEVAKEIFTRLGAGAIITKQPTIAAIKPTTNLTAIAGVYADLAAARASVNTLQGEVEGRLDLLDSKVDAITAALKAAGVISAT